MYMGERAEYGKRSQLAERSPAEYISIISDGMVQIHSELPWYGNKEEVVTISQHLEGLLNHEKGFNINRTFDSI